MTGLLPDSFQGGSSVDLSHAAHAYAGGATEQAVPHFLAKSASNKQAGHQAAACAFIGPEGCTKRRYTASTFIHLWYKKKSPVMKNPAISVITLV